MLQKLSKYKKKKNVWCNFAFSAVNVWGDSRADVLLGLRELIQNKLHPCTLNESVVSIPLDSKVSVHYRQMVWVQCEKSLISLTYKCCKKKCFAITYLLNLKLTLWERCLGLSYLLETLLVALDDSPVSMILPHASKHYTFNQCGLIAEDIIIPIWLLRTVSTLCKTPTRGGGHIQNSLSPLKANKCNTDFSVL